MIRQSKDVPDLNLIAIQNGVGAVMSDAPEGLLRVKVFFEDVLVIDGLDF
jgi:hypothetical protein